METHILLFFIALFCLIVYLARILVFIIFTGKRFHLLSLSRENASNKRRVQTQSSRREKKSEKRVTKTRRSKVVDKK